MSNALEIRPLTDLPNLEKDSTVIDGTTQTVSQGNFNVKGPEIEIDGSALSGYGIVITGSYNKIMGLAINRCSSIAIHILNDHSTISGNYVGTDPTGTIRLPNTDGIVVENLASHNTIGGNTEADRNLVSGNNGLV
jgi:hypothetical protein